MEVNSKPNIYKIIDPKNSATGLKDIYKGWATEYEQDVVKVDFNGPAIAYKSLENYLPNRDARILDLGAGTGLLGMKMKEGGYMNVDAIDPSTEMLDIAKERNCYKNVIVDLVGKNKVDIENDTYDVIIGSGIFAPGHADGDAFDELCRITRPGGYVVIVTCDRYTEDQYDGYAQNLHKAIKEQEAQGKWKCEKRVTEDDYQESYSASVLYMKVL